MIETAVADVMTRSPRTIEPHATVETAARAFINDGIGSLVVIEKAIDGGSDASSEANGAIGNERESSVEAVAGIVTEADVVELVAEGLATTTPVGEVMSAPVISVDASESVRHAAEKMKTERVKKLLVVDDGRSVGIVTTTDLAHYLPRYRLDVQRRDTN